MAKRHCSTFGLALLILSGLFSAPAVAELRPIKAWQCTIAAPDAEAKTESPRDRKITLYEYRSPDNCLDEALPPVGSYVCRADYTKDGATETLWRARNNRDYCRPRTEALVQDLDKAGFFCTALEVEGCDEPAHVAGDAGPAADVLTLPDTEPNHDVQSVYEAEPLQTPEPVAGTHSIKTPTAGTAGNVPPVDKTASREEQLATFFNGLFDAPLAMAMTYAAIPDNFTVYDDSTLSAANGETLRFTRGTHAWETRRDEGVLVINADFHHGTSFNDVFFGFTFDRSRSTNEPDRHQFRYLGVVSPETESEVIYASEDKIIISSKWYTGSSDCSSSRTTDEYRWSDSIYGTLQMRTISVMDNADCAGE
ncbi:MAG: hypothetical protein KJO01_00210 [Gammaproteobacteria bacterium]|nr:hypothetical protein [Gammaproteobacteria bacterium]MBT8109538.1 hypothetical protein [Gammaproteobacteria bacterium]NNL44240.1 hypothetical protein [Woeseiaceae bacterium]